MKIKKSHIILTILVLIMLISIQSISAENNDVLNNNASDVDLLEKLHSCDDFQLQDELTYNNAGNVGISDCKSEKISDKSVLNYDNDKITSSDNDTINIKIEAQNLVSQYQVGTYKFKVTDNSTGNPIANKVLKVSYKISGVVVMTSTQDITTDSEGIATFYLNKINNLNEKSGNLNVGKYNITVTGQGELKGELKTTITIEKTDVLITPTDYKEEKGSSKNFTVKITSKDTGEAIKSAVLSLYIPNTKELYYKITTSNEGIGSISVQKLGIGEYPLTITTNDTNLNTASKDSKITIDKSSVKINVESIMSYFNSGKTAVVKITDKNGKAVANVPVQICIDGVNYVYYTDKNGKSELITSINVGTHKISVKVVGNIYRSNSISKSFTVKKATGKLTVSSKTYYYNSGKYLTVKLTNTKNKKGIFNGKIHFKVQISKTKYSNFYGTTQKDGKIKFNRELNPGSYKVVISGKDSKNFKSKSITIKMTVKKSPLKITTKTSDKQLKLKVTNEKSKKIVSGIKLKIKVHTGKKAKTITAKTDSKGMCTVKSIKTGPHKIVVTSQNSYYILNYKKSIKL